MIKAILFDLDGTLIDTLPDVHAVLNATCERFGYPPVTREQACEYIGDGARQLVARALPKDVKNFEECFEYYHEYYGNCANEHTKPYAGAMEFILKAKAAGIKLGVITNKPHNATVRAIEQFYPDLFDFVAGDSGAFPCKPDPALPRYAALTLRVAPSECAFVGDGEPDALTAINAGMFGVSALWGYRTREQLAAVGATRFARDYAELEKILFAR